MNPPDGTHPLVLQLRYARKEFQRGLRTVSPDDAKARPGSLNAISWSVGHLAWQEQKYFLQWGQGLLPYPEIDKQFRTGAAGSAPELHEMIAVWSDIIAKTDPWLDGLTSERLTGPYDRGDQKRGEDGGGRRPGGRLIGNLIQRVVYHYWFHLGMNQAVRKLLGHQKLPQFVGNIDDEAPYVPEAEARQEP